MADNETLWTAVVAAYDPAGLKSLTNVRDRSATTTNTTRGQSAAQQVIDLWPIYAQEEFAVADAQHLAIGIRGCIAVLWERGGSSAQIARVEWEEVFGDSGLISKLRKTGARARKGPVSNSGVSQKSELINGRAVRGWADRESLPGGIMPSRREASSD